MIGWYTENPLSKTVLQSIPYIDLRHIKDFDPEIAEKHCFYGLLRGASNAMHILAYLKKTYYYIDNGYYDALYVDKNMLKSMEGKFRAVKNGMHEVYPHIPSTPSGFGRVLVIPPSPYSANFYNTTPEDWTMGIRDKFDGMIRIRTKDSLRPLEDDLEWCDTVYAFNSLAVMGACKLGKIVGDSHGILRNIGAYNYDQLKDFYELKQYTLQEMREGKITWC